jgi:hypothetical protein
MFMYNSFRRKLRIDSGRVLSRFFILGTLLVPALSRYELQMRHANQAVRSGPSLLRELCARPAVPLY